MLGIGLPASRSPRPVACSVSIIQVEALGDAIFRASWGLVRISVAPLGELGAARSIMEMVLRMGHGWLPNVSS